MFDIAMHASGINTTGLLHGCTPAPQMVFLKTGNAWDIVMLFYCCHFACLHFKTGMAAKGTLVHSFASLLCLSYGGGIIAPILLGKTIYPLLYDKAVFASLLPWALLRWGPAAARDALKSPLATLLFMVNFEIFRSQVIVNFVHIARANHDALSHVAPIVCGTLGGMGGLLVPLNKGLSAFETAEHDYTIHGAFFAASAYHLLTHPIGAGVIALMPYACSLQLTLAVCMVASRLMTTYFPSQASKAKAQASKADSEGGASRSRSRSRHVD